MTLKNHYQSLTSMYAAAPVNKFYEPTMEVSEGEAGIEIELSEKYHHSAGGVHGSVDFKMLDDSAFFAANSLEEEFFVLTTSFTTREFNSQVHHSLIRLLASFPRTQPQVV